jgi:glycosyltransferase involved in cell wall biosynthesis
VRRVAFFVDSTAFGGAERSALTLLGGLDRERWAPTLVHHGNPHLRTMVDEAAALGVPSLVVPEMADGLRGALRVAPFARTLRGHEFDIFHAQLSWPLMAKFALAGAVAARVPAVLATVHAYPEFTMTAPTAAQQFLLARAVGRYIVVSAHVAERLAVQMHVPRSRIVVIHNAIEAGGLSERTRGEPWTELGEAEPAPHVLSAARLVADKGVDLLIEAAALVPGVRFAVAGEGPEREALERLISERGLDQRFRLLGWRDDVPALLAAADVFALPSRNEAFPVSLLEALAAGTPVVASRVGGVGELITDRETGLLFAVDDVDALAAAISSLIADPALRGRLASAGMAAVRDRFGVAPMVDATVAEYERLLAGSRRPYEPVVRRAPKAKRG